jgi:hypothetical protein
MSRIEIRQDLPVFAERRASDGMRETTFLTVNRVVGFAPLLARWPMLRHRVKEQKAKGNLSRLPGIPIFTTAEPSGTLAEGDLR